MSDLNLDSYLAAAMRANPNASREFLTRALTQTLQQAGHEVTQEQVASRFETVRVQVGWKYMGSPMPLHRNPAARFYKPNAPLPEEDVLPEDLEGSEEVEDTKAAEDVEENSVESQPNIISDYYVTEDESGQALVQGTEFGEYLHRVLSERSDLQATGISRVHKQKDQSYEEVPGSVVVRVVIDSNRFISVNSFVTRDDNLEAKVSQAFDTVDVPEDLIQPGVYDIRIETASPSEKPAS